MWSGHWPWGEPWPSTLHCPATPRPPEPLQASKPPGPCASGACFEGFPSWAGLVWPCPGGPSPSPGVLGGPSSWLSTLLLAWEDEGAPANHCADRNGPEVASWPQVRKSRAWSQGFPNPLCSISRKGTGQRAGSGQVCPPEELGGRWGERAGGLPSGELGLHRKPPPPLPDTHTHTRVCTRPASAASLPAQQFWEKSRELIQLTGGQVEVPDSHLCG